VWGAAAGRGAAAERGAAGALGTARGAGALGTAWEAGALGTEGALRRAAGGATRTRGPTPPGNRTLIRLSGARAGGRAGAGRAGAGGALAGTGAGRAKFGVLFLVLRVRFAVLFLFLLLYRPLIIDLLLESTAFIGLTFAHTKLFGDKRLNEFLAGASGS
jgi:hypothetical protein